MSIVVCVGGRDVNVNCSYGVVGYSGLLIRMNAQEGAGHGCNEIGCLDCGADLNVKFKFKITLILDPRLIHWLCCLCH